MTLTREQIRELNKLSEYLKKVEKLTIENKLDPDVFMSEYNKEDISAYATEKINPNAESRKSVFEKSEREKPKSPAKNTGN